MTRDEGRTTTTARTRSRTVRVASAVVVVGLAAAGCGAGAGAGRTTYTFNAGDSPVKVDTPQLRTLKESAHIRPCPSVGADRAPGALPDVTLPCLGGGRSVDLASLRGPLLLNFWAQWCGTCRVESPLLQQFSAAATGKVSVIGVDFNDPRPSYAIAFAKELGLTYPQLADPDGATRGPLRIEGPPYTFFVNASGNITYTQAGPFTSESELAGLVKEHLGVSVRGAGP